MASGMLFAQGKVAMMANWFGFAAYADTAEDSRVRGLVDRLARAKGKDGVRGRARSRGRLLRRLRKRLTVQPRVSTAIWCIAGA